MTKLHTSILSSVVTSALLVACASVDSFVKSADGGFTGVHSLSENMPLKTAGFAVRDAAFEGKTKYSDWQFAFAPAPPK